MIRVFLRRGVLVRLASLIAATVLLGGSAHAQLTNATLVGTVQDSAGAVVTDAGVSIRNTATNEIRSDRTSPDGIYRLPNLVPGTYEIRVEKAGFKLSVTPGVILHVGETSRVNVTLQVGQVNEQVEVSGGAPEINTEESRITHVVEGKQLEELPLTQRNIYQLPVLEPGTQPARIQIPTYYNTSVYDLGFVSYGKRIRSTNFILDGAPNTDSSTGGVPAISPILDSVQEFQVSTTNFGREFGRNFGAIINVVSKSGSNGFHGSVWEFNRTAALNARNYFDPKEKSALVHNQFGLTLGGPIRKDKTFWFGAYEGFRERRGVTRKVNVETPQLRNYVATNFPNSVANYLFQNFAGPTPDPSTAVSLGIQGNGASDIGIGTGQKVNSITTDQYNLRFDDLFRNSLDRVFVRWSAYYPRTTGVGELTTIGRLGRSLRGFRRPLEGFIGNLGVGYTHVFSHDLLNDFRFGYLRNRAFAHAFPANVPNIVLDDFTLGFGSDYYLPLNFTDNVFNFRDTVIRSSGRHGLKFGVEYNHDREVGELNAVSRGYYEFFSLTDFVADSPYLQQLQIDPSTGQNILSSPNRFRHFRRRDFAWFIQDDWKLRNNLTLNLGLRHEYFGVLTETNGKQGGIILGSGSTFNQQFVNARFGALKQLYEPYWKNFAPSIGLAWDPFSNGKFSVRAGFAINYDRLHSDLITEPARFSPPFSAFAIAAPSFGICNSPIPYTVADVIAAQPTPDADFAAPLNSAGALSLCRFSPLFISPKLKSPYVEEWNLTLQYELAREWVLELGYVGNEGHRIAFAQDPNRFPASPDPNNPNRLNPNLLWVDYLSTNTNSSYNGATVQVKHNFARGFLFQANYTFGKALDIQDDAFAGDFTNAGTGYWGTQDVNNIQADRGRSSFDIRHRFTVNAVWEIGKLPNQSAPVRAVFGGLQTNLIFSWESGRPFSVINTGVDYNNDGGGGTQGGAYDRPDTPAFGNSIGCPSPQRFASGVFSPSDFPVPAFGHNGTLGRNTFCGPNYKSVDLSLVKNFSLSRLGELAKLQFRAEGFNLFNRPNLYLPDFDLAGNPLTFGKSTQALSAREFQFGLKLSW